LGNPAYGGKNWRFLSENLEALLLSKRKQKIGCQTFFDFVLCINELAALRQKSTI